MIPVILIGGVVLGAGMVFGYSSVVVGLVLMLACLIGLTVFMSTPGTVRRPGDRETVVERRFMGNHDDHRDFRA
ncbi:hypothetical protein [Streptomyces justiciae]|uniref:Uncharacterized protein n=1 Tax=Streptomyces justiciae TaxID=2780140 RepID=A0ABU3LLC8_9ACTN|nr:hypothetical protein [Streptomyces justiciae]MBE8471967.1 hypothetical protein [Streptomyces justiciae]MCW8376157.1 hypothetical protein [Streptomyces justiciae]MDT7839952.1 hypothetical protein [Streptomyces justiciae]